MFCRPYPRGLGNAVAGEASRSVEPGVTASVADPIDPCQWPARAPSRRRQGRAFWLAAVALLAPPAAGALESVPDFGDNPGGLSMHIHRPAHAAPGLPLVVALHGCQQGAADLDDETGLVALAEETPFVLLLPEQSSENNSLRCFRWFDTRDNRPGRGESASILAMIDAAVDREAVDPERVFVLGLSAGGAMTAVLLANYPERFAGGAIIAGTPFDCNRPVSAFDWTWYWLNTNPFAPDGADASYACGIRGLGTTDRDAAEWGGFVRAAADAEPTRWPRVSIWQGAADGTVDPDNLRELVEQWTDVHGIDAVPDKHDTEGGAVRDVYTDANGVARVEAWMLDGFGHAVPIDAYGDPASCGAPGAYVENADLCAVRRIAAFWRIAE